MAGPVASLISQGVSKRLHWLLPVCVAVLALAGCATAPLNAPHGPARDPVTYSLDRGLRDPGPDRLLVMLYFSGGGSRAAALGYGVLQELAQTPLPGGGRMLDQVGTISAVSGGCFPAAYYCLYGDRTFTEFAPTFLYRNVQGKLYGRCFGPAGLVRLCSSRFGRSDLAAEYYDELLFHGATFGDLARGPATRPLLVINATHISNGEPFQFLQEQFDLIGSDLNRYPISRAVAASSAFPILLTPVALQNHARPASGRAAPKLPPERGLAMFTNVREDTARAAAIYGDSAAHPYLHLADGGLSDNLGMRGMYNFVAQQGGWGNVMDELRRAGVDKLVLIVVNAAIVTGQEWDCVPDTPTGRTVIRAMSNALINQSNRGMLNSVRTSLRVWEQQRKALRQPGDPEDPKVYFVNVSFNGIADAAERERFHRVPTRFNLGREQADFVVAKAGELLRRSPDFLQLIQDLQSPPAAP